MLASPLTATIYLPLLPLLATAFNVTVQDINLTITLYVIFQAISPLIFATASDHFGRRPILLLTYALYTIASLGLSLDKNNYATLLVLRGVQSLGASAVLAIAFGVVADICPPAERGSMLGPTQGAANTAVCLGPVVGGLVAWKSGSFRWIFWALTIFGGLVFGIILVGLWETARNLVGNGSVQISTWYSPWWILMSKAFATKGNPITQSTQVSIRDEDVEEPKGSTVNTPVISDRSSFKSKLRMANPLCAFRIMLFRDTALVLWLASSPYAVWYCVQASISDVYKNTYGFNDIDVGLAFLTGGAGTVVGGIANGKFMDWNYRVTAKKCGREVDKVAGDDLIDFPIERARARGSLFILAGYICTLAGYGWSTQVKSHVAVPLILQFILAAICTSFQQTYNALLVDVFPSRPSTAAAASNILRCTLSAAAVSVLEPIVRGIGRGWFFTMLSGVSGGGGIICYWVLITRGMHWRQARLAEKPATSSKQIQSWQTDPNQPQSCPEDLSEKSE